MEYRGILHSCTRDVLKKAKREKKGKPRALFSRIIQLTIRRIIIYNTNGFGVAIFYLSLMLFVITYALSLSPCKSRYIIQHTGRVQYQRIGFPVFHVCTPYVVYGAQLPRGTNRLELKFSRRCKAIVCNICSVLYEARVLDEIFG